MNCPGHILIYKRKLVQLRELPVRYRGAGHGLPRRALGGVCTDCCACAGSRRTTRTSSARPNSCRARSTTRSSSRSSLLTRFGFDKFSGRAVACAIRPIPASTPAPTTSGDGGDGARGRGEAARPRLHARWRARRSSTAPRSTSRSSTPSGGPGSSRPSSSISTCRAASTSTTSPAAAASGPWSWSTGRLFGSIERFMGDPHRALRRRLSDLARAGAVCRCCRFPAIHCRVRRRGAERPGGTRAFASRWTPGRKRSVTGSAKPRSTRSRSWRSSGEREATEGLVAVRARGKGMVGTKPLADFVTEIVDEVAAGG